MVLSERYGCGRVDRQPKMPPYLATTTLPSCVLSSIRLLTMVVLDPPTAQMKSLQSRYSRGHRPNIRRTPFKRRKVKTVKRRELADSNRWFGEPCHSVGYTPSEGCLEPSGLKSGPLVEKILSTLPPLFTLRLQDFERLLNGIRRTLSGQC